MLTLAEVLELPVVRRGLPEVVAGHELLGRELRWAHVIEMPDPADLLKGGELVLTTGLGPGPAERDQQRWIRSLIDQGVAAVGVELGRVAQVVQQVGDARPARVVPAPCRARGRGARRAANRTVRRNATSGTSPSAQARTTASGTRSRQVDPSSTATATAPCSTSEAIHRVWSRS